MDALVLATADSDLLTTVVECWRHVSASPTEVLLLGDGTAAGLAVRAGERRPIVVPGGADGASMPATLVVADGAAWVAADEMGHAPSSGAIGHAVLAAAELAPTVYLLADGVAVPDGGADLLRAIATGPSLVMPAPGAPNDDVIATVRAARRRLATRRLVCLTDDDVPLLGLTGVSALRAGADGQARESALSALAHDAARAVEMDRPSLVAGGGERETLRALTAAGAGAGGGLGFAVRALGGVLEPAADVMARAANLDAHIVRTDVVVVVVDVLDGTALHAGVVPDVVRRAAEVGVPVIVVAREVRAGRRELLAAGVAGAYPAQDDAAAAVRRVARTWTRR